MVKDEINVIVKQLVDQLSQIGITVHSAYLYGSYARGEEKRQSDIDLMIVSKIFDNDDDQSVGKVWRISKSIDLRIEPYTVGLNRFKNDDVSPLLQIIKNEGFQIYKTI